MQASRRSVSIRSQSVFLILLLVVGWLFGSTDLRFGMSSILREGIADVAFWTIPIFTLILLVSFFRSNRAHRRWFYLALGAVVVSYIAMTL